MFDKICKCSLVLQLSIGLIMLFGTVESVELDIMTIPEALSYAIAGMLLIGVSQVGFAMLRAIKEGK